MKESLPSFFLILKSRAGRAGGGFGAGPGDHARRGIELRVAAAARGGRGVCWRGLLRIAVRSAVSAVARQRSAVTGPSRARPRGLAARDGGDARDRGGA